MRKYVTLANILTVVSLITAIVAYYNYAEVMGATSLATGTAAFIAGLAV